ncbi:uncharacterized protein LOC108864355 [Galendromus occidentalis]|uniref:Uncharacterized protein LOC108864355 n=1 Tax=Galendromus occidentalis TaxID=34638 RepID=A0AAJ7L492_9ACAR|nr:uncharacterized protein LOC108864355 [Galendromus occidentalis]
MRLESVVSLSVLLAISSACDPDGFRRDSSTCDRKFHNDLQRTGFDLQSNFNCCPFHQMVECMKLAARYSDCGKERLHIGEIKRLRQSQGLTRADCIEGKEQCQLRLYEI